MLMHFSEDHDADIEGFLVESMEDDTTPLATKKTTTPCLATLAAQASNKHHLLPQTMVVGPVTNQQKEAGGIKRKRRSRVNGNNIKELVDSMKNLAMVLQSSEDRKDACEDARGKRFLEIKEAKNKATRDSANAICGSLNRVADSIASLAIRRE
ncbi:hypothetical protein GOP47_0026280 [Adiantum capillus-veneris]|nr:hypothetical protein GOP47_0026280 [Adiantum capillus-veneris]